MTAARPKSGHLSEIRPRPSEIRPESTAHQRVGRGTHRAERPAIHTNYVQLCCWLASLPLSTRRRRDAEAYFCDAVIFATDGARHPVTYSRPFAVLSAARVGEQE